MTPTVGKLWNKSCLLAALRLGVCAVLLAAVAAAVGAWVWRVPLATRAARRALDKQGFQDLHFELARLSLGEVALRGVWLGESQTNAVFSAENMECLFSVSGLLRQEIHAVRVSRVRLPEAVVEGGRVSFPSVAARFASGTGGGGDGSGDGAGLPWLRVDAVALTDVSLPIRRADQARAAVALSLARVGLVLSEQWDGAYTVFADLSDTLNDRVTLSGVLNPMSGVFELTSEISVADTGALIKTAQSLFPEFGPLPVALSSSGLTVRVKAGADSMWTNGLALTASAELARGAVVRVPASGVEVTLQSLRMELSGGLDRLAATWSAGLAGIRVGEDIRLAADTGRLLSVRGSAQFGNSPTGRVASVQLSTDLSGRAAQRVLPDILPLLPKLLTDGGTLAVDAELSQAVGGPWRGAAHVLAQARRTALTLPTGRFTADRAAFDATFPLEDWKPGEVTAVVSVENGMYALKGDRARGDLRINLLADPPYDTAVGKLELSLSADDWLAKYGVKANPSQLSFEGLVSGEKLLTDPTWCFDPKLKVGQTVSSASETVNWQFAVQNSSLVKYGASALSFSSVAIIQDFQGTWTGGSATNNPVTFSVPYVLMEVGTTPRGCFSGEPEPFDPATAKLTLSARAKEARVQSDVLTVEKLTTSVSCDWSLAKGFEFTHTPELTWQSLAAGGLALQPDGLTFAQEEGAVIARLGVKVADSALGVNLSAAVPLADPAHPRIRIEVPEAELEPDDAVLALLRTFDGQVTVAGKVKAEAEARLTAGGVEADGAVSLADGRVTRGELGVSGLTASVPFELDAKGARTAGRPFVAFSDARAGNLRFGRGRLDFQATPQEFFVDRFDVAWCKGSLNLYSVHLGFKELTEDVVVYADRVDLGEALMMLHPFKGQVDGLLFGRFPMGIDKGHVKLSTGYLYSLPGQGGRLKMDSNAEVLSLLENAGIEKDVQKPLSNALSDLDFSTLKLELEPEQDGDGTLRIKLSGKSNDKKWPAPVDLNLNFHGALEKLVNMGLDLSRK
ncbi:MAG: YdbH domain-containing protein [Verrucomicrobiota bacterium]|jgi:hypothetical protein|nr:YdbH domain-containing protein [Verrucomicrobiota bacterium]